MTRRLVILTEIISPYRIPLFNALARHEAVSLHVIFLAETDPSLRQWRVYKDEIQFSYEVLPSWRRRIGRYNLLLNSGVDRALHRSSPDIILCGGYNYAASWQTLLWARNRRVPLVLWSESNQQDSRRGYAAIEYLKRRFMGACAAFVVPGISARSYLRNLRVADEKIFSAPNAIDNDLFATAANNAKQNAVSRRKDLGLPERYFLFVGRLVREKGVFDLLAAYAKLDASLKKQFGLVFAGDGACRQQLKEQAASITPGTVTFAGFSHREQLAAIYGLADALILPTYSDPWGLVVNEAMACGLPIIVSQVAGCAADLVKDNWNGFQISPRDVLSLHLAMENLAVHDEQRETMAANSLQRISGYSPETWCAGILSMMKSLSSNA